MQLYGENWQARKDTTIKIVVGYFYFSPILASYLILWKQLPHQSIQKILVLGANQVILRLFGDFI